MPDTKSLTSGAVVLMGQVVPVPLIEDGMSPRLEKHLGEPVASSMRPADMHTVGTHHLPDADTSQGPGPSHTLVHSHTWKSTVMKLSHFAASSMCIKFNLHHQKSKN